MTEPQDPLATAAALPRFFDRIADAIGPVADLDPDRLAEIVGAVRVTVAVADHAGDDPALREQALLAVGLLARLYPRLAVSGPEPFAADLVARVLAIHPGADVLTAPGLDVGTAGADGPVLLLQRPAPAEEAPEPQPAGEIRVEVSGWNVAVDRTVTDDGPPEPLAALAGACVGVGEVFRSVFADRLPDGGRAAPTPAELNVLTCGPGQTAMPRLPGGTDMTGAVLAGAGAIGQAFLLALRTADPTGTLSVADDDTISLANLQRYVLTDDTSPGTAKTAAAAAALAGTRLAVEQIPARWGTDPRTAPGRRVVAVALDTAADRIGVAAGLHDRIYNAWTQPEDLGWSRHENDPGQPCLACAYWPDRPRPNDHELIGQAIGQHPLRALLYLVHRVPIGAPLPVPADGILRLPDAPGLTAPPDVHRWYQVPLAADLVTSGVLQTDDLATWAPLPLADVYRDGVCAGGLLAAGPAPGDREALVPLAHQSALAGVMLAVQVLVAAHPKLAARRPTHVEGRVDMLRPLPQRLSRPRQPTPGCLCSDADFRTACPPG